MTRKRYRRKTLKYNGFFRYSDYPDIIIRINGKKVTFYNYRGTNDFRLLQPWSLTLNMIHNLISTGKWIQIPPAEAALVI